MDTKTAPGDVYELDQNNILIYDSVGIGLRLNQRNIATLRNAVRTSTPLKDFDTKNRPFVVAFDPTNHDFCFEPKHGEPIRVEAWNILPEIYQRNAA